MSYKKIKETDGTILYKDFDLVFKKKTTSNDIRTKSDADAIKQQLKNMIFTSKGEKPFQPQFDIGVYELLFEPFDDITIDVLKDRILIAIENYIDRIKVIDLKVSPTRDNNQLTISLKFAIENKVSPQEISFIVTRRK